MEYHHDNMFSNFPHSIGSSIEKVTPTYDQITIIIKKSLNLPFKFFLF